MISNLLNLRSVNGQASHRARRDVLYVALGEASSLADAVRSDYVESDLLSGVKHLIPCVTDLTLRIVVTKLYLVLSSSIRTCRDRSDELRHDGARTGIGHGDAGISSDWVIKGDDEL